VAVEGNKIVVGYAAEMSKKCYDDMLRVQSIKIHPEGNWTAPAAPFLEDYLDTGKAGDVGVPPERTKALTLSANKAGLTTVVHTDGDASARAAIDAFEAANKAGYGGRRNAVHHLIWVHPDDYKRIVDMKIPISSTPGFGNEFRGQAEPAISWLGEDRVKAEFTKYPDLARDGVKVFTSADVLSMPLTSQAPLFQVEGAVTLKDPSYKDSKACRPAGRRCRSSRPCVPSPSTRSGTSGWRTRSAASRWASWRTSWCWRPIPWKWIPCRSRRLTCC
jgi:predicted amidohydrolase YtcJ